MRREETPLLVMSGTASVYGQPERMPIPESCPTVPNNPYGASKLFMERMLADFETACGLRWISLRYFNAAGADPEGECGEMHAPETHLIPRAFMAAVGVIPRLELFGDDYPHPGRHLHTRLRARARSGLGASPGPGVPDPRRRGPDFQSGRGRGLFSTANS